MESIPARSLLELDKGGKAEVVDYLQQLAKAWNDLAGSVDPSRPADSLGRYRRSFAANLERDIEAIRVAHLSRRDPGLFEARLRAVERSTEEALETLSYFQMQVATSLSRADVLAAIEGLTDLEAEEPDDIARHARLLVEILEELIRTRGDLPVLPELVEITIPENKSNKKPRPNKDKTAQANQLELLRKSEIGLTECSGIAFQENAVIGDKNENVFWTHPDSDQDPFLYGKTPNNMTCKTM